MGNQEYFENRPVTMNDKNNLLQIEEHAISKSIAVLI